MKKVIAMNRLAVLAGKKDGGVLSPDLLQVRVLLSFVPVIDVFLLGIVQWLAFNYHGVIFVHSS